MEGILIIIYVVLGYWACGKTIYANKIRIGRATDLIINRIIIGSIFGFILIPVAFLRVIFRF